MSNTLWIKSSPNTQAQLRLFCLPYAGGAASIYRTWHQSLSNEIDVCAIQLPGRENRIRETPFTDIRELVRDLIPHILPALDRPFAIFGHSMGALIAYELTKQLESAYDQQPTHLFVSGRRAPSLPEPEQLLHDIPHDETFLHALQERYKNVPALLFEEPELRELFVPLLRADLQLVETYDYQNSLPLTCPLVAFGGDADDRVSRDDLRAWQGLTSGDFASHIFSGGHFFLTEDPRPLLLEIARCLDSAMRY